MQITQYSMICMQIVQYMQTVEYIKGTPVQYMQTVEYIKGTPAPTAIFSTVHCIVWHSMYSIQYSIQHSIVQYTACTIVYSIACTLYSMVYSKQRLLFTASRCFIT